MKKEENILMQLLGNLRDNDEKLKKKITWGTIRLF